MKIRLAGEINDSIVDGPGIRYTIFFQGCYHNCPECHNQHTHDPNGGYESETAIVLDKIKSNFLLDGVTFSGGKWVARVNINKKQTDVYRGDSKEEAIKARLQAEKEYYGEFAPQQHLYKQYGIA